MPRKENKHRFQTAAALASLGVLPPPEAREFREHLAQGCEACGSELQAFESVASQLAMAAPELQPPPRLRDTLLARIDDARPRMHVVRNTEGKWKPSPFPGVTVKTLFFDRETAMMTNLVRMDPRASYPPHRHTAMEQCLVLEGDVRQDDVVLGPGDYSRNDPLSDHSRLYTENGCLLLIISSARDELFA